MIRFSIPIKTINEANGSHGHWAAKASRRKRQRQATSLALRASGPHIIKAPEAIAAGFFTPYRVLLRRISAGLLDTDALPLSLKSIRDQIAEELGVTDGPTDSRVTWEYDQVRGKRGVYSVEVTIT